MRSWKLDTEASRLLKNEFQGKKIMNKREKKSFTRSSAVFNVMGKTVMVILKSFIDGYLDMPDPAEEDPFEKTLTKNIPFTWNCFQETQKM